MTHLDNSTILKLAMAYKWFETPFMYKLNDVLPEYRRQKSNEVIQDMIK